MVTATANYAFDKQSARSFDADGRMRVRDCVISVSEINPYYGKEIPRSADLGLAPNTVYDLYRDPGELERGAASFNGLPLMIRHIAQTAKEPRKDYIGGSVVNAHYTDGKLRADLLVWDQQAIEYIESGDLADLSSSYRYRADMTPVEINGRPAHGSMRDIEGNHVALVENGRATGAHVADSALSPQPGDTNVDPTANTDGNAALAEAVLALTEKLDALCTDVAELRAGSGPQNALDEAAQAEADKVKAAEDEAAAEKAKEDESKGEHAMDAKIKSSVDAAVAAAVEATNRKRDELDAAKKATRQVLGDVIAMDDAAGVYRAALIQSGWKDGDIPAGAEASTWRGFATGTSARTVHAMDSRAVDGSAEPFFKTPHIRARG